MLFSFGLEAYFLFLWDLLVILKYSVHLLNCCAGRITRVALLLQYAGESRALWKTERKLRSKPLHTIVAICLPKMRSLIKWTPTHRISPSHVQHLQKLLRLKESKESDFLLLPLVSSFTESVNNKSTRFIYLKIRFKNMIYIFLSVIFQNITCKNASNLQFPVNHTVLRFTQSVHSVFPPAMSVYIL